MNFKLKQLGQGIALASLLAAGGMVSAAEDGTLGATSTGSLDVLVSIADRVQISGLDDIDLGAYSGSGELTGSDSFCVYRNGTGLYDVEISSANADGGAFRMVSGTDNFLTYTVTFAGEAVSSGEEIEGAGHSTSVTCGGGTNTTLAVSVAEAALQGAVSGSYADTVTMVVSPR